MDEIYRFLKLLFIWTVLIAWTHPANSQDSCIKWFNDLKVDQSSSDCEIKCSSGKVSLGTIDCPLECPKYCKAKSKCELSAFWNNVLSSPSEPMKKLSEDQLSSVKNSISKFPNEMQPRALKGIATTKATIDLFNPLNAATVTNDYVILFPRAFSDSEDLTRILFHEIVHHMVQNEWAPVYKRYLKVSGWSSSKQKRPGKFVEPDGLDSPEEDFANNLEYFVFDRTHLKNTSPNLFRWIENELGKQLKLKKGCA